MKIERQEKQQVIRATANINKPKAVGTIDLSSGKVGAPKVQLLKAKEEKTSRTDKLLNKKSHRLL